MNLQETTRIIEALAEGIHPFTCEMLPQASPQSH